MPSDSPPFHPSTPAVLGMLAWSGSGKTTLLRGLIPALAKHGIRCSAIKTTHHDVELDKPGKDSYEIRKAGAYQTLLLSPRRHALISELDGHREPSLDTALEQLDTQSVDLVMVEGFRDSAIPKLEIHRPSQQRDTFFPQHKEVIAIACDSSMESGEIPQLDLNQPEAIAIFIIDHFKLG
ncbi:MAG: molybdopterin-guanine dinucleotide biosynthesis protein B [bacterium]